MKSRSRTLAEHSVKMALAAIEIYNKPDFKNREQIFTILMVAAWESLLKAKILKDNKNQPKSIYVKEGGRYKRKKRTKQHFTVGLDDSIARCQLPEVLRKNIESLEDVRDAAIHLTAESEVLPYIVFSLGAATLRNYARLVEKWFRLGLREYNFYILPLGFSYPFKTMSTAVLRKEPEEIAEIVREITAAQNAGCASDGEYFLVCQIQTTLVSAKKLTDATDLTVAVQAPGPQTIVVDRLVNPRDRYPYTYREVLGRIRKECPGVKQAAFDSLIKETKIKGDPRYSDYNYRSKLEEKRGPSKATAVIYNEDFVRFAIQELGSKSGP